MLIPHLPPNPTEKGRGIGCLHQLEELGLQAVCSRAEISLIQYLLILLRCSLSYMFGLQEFHEKFG